MPRILYFQGTSPLLSLAEACLALTPKVSCVGNKQVFLEVSCTEKIFGGEDALVARARALANALELPAQVVLTDRLEWANPLASPSPVLLAQGGSRRALFSLPIARIYSCGDPTKIEEESSQRASLIEFLQKLGFQTIGDFASLDAANIAKHFGRFGTHLHDWVWGRREVILPLFVPEEKIRESIDTEEIGSLEALLFYLRTQLVRIEARLHARSLFAKALRLHFTLDSGSRFERELKILEPTQDASVLLRLLRDLLRESDWDSPLCRLEVEVSDTFAYQAAQLSLFDKSENRAHDLALFVNRLQARFGLEAVGYPELRESYLPEFSWAPVWPRKPERKVDLARLPPSPLRPPLLFDPPKPCPNPPAQWKFQLCEKVESEWWRGTGGKRNYYIVDTREGNKWWMYRDQVTHEWFIHGSFE